MVNHQLIDSEISVTFSEIQYLIQLIYATGNPRERNLAMGHLWKKVSNLHLLVGILQSELNKVFQQQPRPNAIHPFQQFQTNTMPVQGGFRISQAQAGHAASQPLTTLPGYPASQPIRTQTAYRKIQHSQIQSGNPPTQPSSSQQVYPLSQPQLAYTVTQLSPFQSQPAYPVTQLTPSQLHRTFPVNQQSTQLQPGNPTPQPGNPNGQTFTREQLTQFNGMNGMPAYVGVNGVVYDVTNNAAWSLATHFGLSAGRDLTAEFASCHAGQQWILAQLKPIGRLI